MAYRQQQSLLACFIFYSLATIKRLQMTCADKFTLRISQKPHIRYKILMMKVITEESRNQSIQYILYLELRFFFFLQNILDLFVINI
jgi:hypothetical protein